ncbi:MAG: S-layer homology domain-containing protein, partial [Patescibacteria group bacterium]
QLEVNIVGGGQIEVMISSTLESGDLTVVVNGESSDPYPVSVPSTTITTIEFHEGEEFEADFTINGTNFNASQSGNTVTIYSTDNSDSFELTVKSASTTKIIAELPDEPFRGYLTVTKNGWTSNAEDIELLLLPELIGMNFAGSYFDFSEIVTLTGHYFNPDEGKQIVVLEDGDGDATEGIEVTPFEVAEDGTYLKFIVPADVAEGELHVEINDYQSNSLTYEMTPGPQIWFNDNSAYRDSATGNVVLSINGSGFSTTSSGNVVYVNGTAATVIGQYGTSILTANLGTPDPTGNIYVKTNGYKGNTVDYDLQSLLLPNISSMRTNNGFFPGRTITITGINFTDSTILADGGDEGELYLSTNNTSEYSMTAYISAEAEIGQEITVQFRDGFYTGSAFSFTVGDTSTFIEIEEPEVEEADEETEEELPEAEEDDLSGSAIDFPDVSGSDWFFAAVEELSSREVVSGKSDGNFHPADSITRAEFLKMTLLTLDISVPVSSGNSFFDTAQHWAKDYIEEALEQGIIDDADYFNPDATITRAEATKILVNALGLSFEDASGVYFEDTATHWGVLHIATAYEETLVEGFTDESGFKYFRPDQNMNRAEAAKILFETLE